MIPTRSLPVTWLLVLLLPGLFTGAAAGQQASEPPTIPVGLDAYRQWENWPVQRIGARAYMRSTYDRHGRNHTADASGFLYQEADDFNVSLDVEGAGILYFVRTNHWHGSPWHYEIDGVDQIVQETTTATPNEPAADSVFLPEAPFPRPLTWTWSTTKGADLMWVPIPFEESLRLAYSRTFYGTGYYIYHQYAQGTPLSQPIEAWKAQPPDPDVLELIDRSGTDIAPTDIPTKSGTFQVGDGGAVELARLEGEPATIRALKLTLPRQQALEIGKARLRITWDDRPEASIDAPLALFFGAGILYNRDDREYLVKGFPMNVRYTDDTVELACYYPMPFFRSATIELVDCDLDAPADIDFEIRHEPYTGPANHVGYFHATYQDHPQPEPGHDLVLLDTRAVEGGGDWSGTFVGTSFIFSHDGNLTTLEGDPRFFFDDNRTPSYGTGTEEWGGGGDYWGGVNMTLPFAGHPTGSRSREEAKDEHDLVQSAYRFLVADLFPFGKNALIRLEHGGENLSTEHYETVTYWYGLPAASLVKTDELDVGEINDERDHAYDSPDATEPQEITSRYEWGVDTIPDHGAASPLAEPDTYAEWEFEAEADTTYHIWIRGRALEHNNHTDAVWIQFNDQIGTERPGIDYAPYGLGNWLDGSPDLGYRWSSGRPQDPPVTIRFDQGGRQRLRIQPRHPGHVVDQIWLSPTQTQVPDAPDARTGEEEGQIILDVATATLEGAMERIEDEAASVGEAIHVKSEPIVVYPPHTEFGRQTTGTSEFTLQIRPDNLGVFLRRTLDYSVPNQRALISIADASDGRTEGFEWEPAGHWYTAGSNTWYHSWPDGELAPTKPVVMTSNRRFRDEEFLIPRRLTDGRSAIRIRVEHTPVDRPLLPGGEVQPSAWTEIRYSAWCWIMPEFTPPENR